MKELVWNLKDIFQDDHEFEESFDEKRTFQSRALHRREAYRKKD